MRKTISARGKLEKHLDALWGDIVRRQWYGTCAWPGCFQPGNQPHHFFHRAQGNKARWNIFNGVCLCFAHHIRKVHQEGNTEPIRDALIMKIGSKTFEQLKLDVRGMWKPTMVELSELKKQMEVLAGAGGYMKGRL